MSAKMTRYRSRMRERGLRPVQFWVRDLRDPAQVERIRREVAALRRHPSDTDGNRFLDAALTDIEGWDA